MPQTKKSALISHFSSQPDIKRIQVYVNGDEFNSGYKFVVHPKQIRNFDVLLSELTDKIQPGFGAVRYIYTPINGTRVRSLSSLQHEGQYVVGGVEPFRVYNYPDIEVLQIKADISRKPTTVSKAKRPQKNRFQTSAPKRRNSGLRGRDPIIIFVYRNGDDVTPAERFIVRKAELNNWELFLQRIGQTLLSNTGYIKRLYDMNGQWIRGSKGMKHGEFYVAVGGYEAFRHVMYGKVKADKPSPVKFNANDRSGPSNNTRSKTKTASKLTKSSTTVGKTISTSVPTGLTKSNQRHTTTTMTKSNSQDRKPAKPATIAVTAKTKSTKTVSENPIHNSTIKRPNDSEDSAYVSDSDHRGRKGTIGKNKISSNRANTNRLQRRNDNSKAFQIIDSSHDDGIFYARPAVPRSPRRVKMVDYDEDSGGVYKSKEHVKDAQEVQESDDVNVDLPIDQLEALEIKDEDVERGDKIITSNFGKIKDGERKIRDISTANGTPFKMATEVT